MEKLAALEADIAEPNYLDVAPPAQNLPALDGVAAHLEKALQAVPEDVYIDQSGDESQEGKNG